MHYNLYIYLHNIYIKYALTKYSAELLRKSMQSNASTKKEMHFSQASKSWFKTFKNKYSLNNLKYMGDSHSAEPYATTAMFPKLLKQMNQKKSPTETSSKSTMSYLLLF